MGYSHYWRREKEIVPVVFQKIVGDFTKLIDHMEKVGVKLYGDRAGGEIVLNENEVRFIGINKYTAPSRFEPFYFPRVVDEKDGAKPDKSGKCRARCTTGFEPYDLAAVAFLIIAKHYLKEAIEVKSDGTSDNWFDGKLICHVTLGYGYEYNVVDGVLREVDKE